MMKVFKTIDLRLWVGVFFSTAFWLSFVPQALANSVPKDDRGSLVQPGGNSNSVTAGATSIVQTIGPVINPIISFLVWVIAFALVVGMLILLAQATIETHKNGGSAGVRRFMKGSGQAMSLVMLISGIGLFFSYMLKFFYDDGVQQQLASSKFFTPDKGDISLDNAFQSVEGVITNITQPIILWICAGFLTIMILLILWAVFTGVSKVHSGAANALRYAFDKIGTYILLLAAGFMISTIVGILLTFGSI